MLQWGCIKYLPANKLGVLNKMTLVEQYKEDRAVTRAMVESTFRRDNVPEDMIEEYFKCYDTETECGNRIAQWLDENRSTEIDATE